MPTRTCAFCGVHKTTATLEDGVPVCWRPCYAALLKIHDTMKPERAVYEALDESPTIEHAPFIDAVGDLDGYFKRLARRYGRAA